MFSKNAFHGRLAVTRLVASAACVLCCHICLPALAEHAPPDWIEWQHRRNESIGGTNGWTTLISLHWLPEGTTSVGSNPTNKFVLPADRVPGFVGTFSRKGDSVQFQAAPEVTATSGGTTIHQLDMQSDASANPSKLKVGTLSFVVIKRGERYGVRVRDPESPRRHHFTGLQYFPYDPSWRLEGRFEPFPVPQTLRVPDATGGIQELTSPGTLVFTHAGKECRLDAVDEGGNEYFMIFTDATAGSSTYDAGRFLYVPKADASGHVTIDFNRAFTPPCGFTSFATCPRPPDQNSLPFAIEAGERKPADAH